MKMRKLLAGFLIGIMTLTATGCSSDDIQKIIESDKTGEIDWGAIIPEKDDTVQTYTTDEDLTTWVYSGKAWEEVNNNEPTFTAEELEEAKKSYETYGEFDSLGRCTTAVASVGQDIMPTDKRGSISSVKPTGWVNKKYDKELVEGGYLYNRCHLIGYQMTGENANANNLITGTRYLNIDGMLDFEDEVTQYVKDTGNHVLYRVTPVYKDDELVARGVHMEGYSVEDDGDGVSFNVYAYNVQPGIVIDYATGESELE